VSETKLRVAVADDQALVRAGFRMILEAEGDMEVVAEACDGEEAISCVRRLRPDVLLMDIRMPKLDGLAATRRLLGDSACTCRILILTTFDLDEYVYAALQAGASGFLLKDVTPERLVASVRQVMDGDALLAPSITRRLIERFTKPRDTASSSLEHDLSALTPREMDVLKLLGRGLNNAEIARKLVLTEATVKTHVAHVFRKIDVRDRAQAVVVAYETGVLQAGS
jgi:DNA-binding NarL/FixJ family response regulator